MITRMDKRPTMMAESLSERERQLVVLASKGLTDTAIALKLGISLATVGTYWGRVRIKFGPLNRTELVAVFLQEQAATVVDGLRAENKLLLDTLDEKSKTELMLKTSLELFRGLVETAPDAILLVNQDGIVQLANVQAEETFGYNSTEMLGLQIELLVPERYRHNHVENRASYHENPVKRRMGEHMATFALRKDGTEFPMATALSATETHNGLLVTCIVRDLTDTLDAFAR
jgi:PAS domain S-box-containing protein